MTIVHLIGVVQCLFIAIALLYLPDNRKQASRWLAALFAVFVLYFGYMALQQNDLLHLAPLATFLRLPLFFLYGPLLYLYLFQVTHSWEQCQLRKAWPHLVPFVLVFVIYSPSLTFDHNTLLHAIYYRELVQLFPFTPGLSETQQWLLFVSRFVLKLFVLHLLVYVWMSLQLLHRHKQRVSQLFSRLDKVSLDWMRNLLLAQVSIWIVLAVRQWAFANTGIGNLIDMALIPVLVLYLSALGLYGLLQKSIPLPAPATVDPAAAGKNQAGAKYQSSGLTEQQQIDLIKKLKALMLRDRPQRDSELTLTGIAERLDLTARQLSQLINGGLGQSFIDFVNGYRVEDAKALLADRSCTSSVLTIAMEVGFNSKSAFYSAFKRHTGQTPSQFRNDCIAALPDPQT